MIEPEQFFSRNRDRKRKYFSYIDNGQGIERFIFLPEKESSFYWSERKQNPNSKVLKKYNWYSGGRHPQQMKCSAENINSVIPLNFPWELEFMLFLSNSICND